MPRIVIADDEWVTRVEIEEMLTGLGYEVVGQAEIGAEAIDMVRSLEPDLVIMDVTMPGEMNGIEAAKVIKAESGIPIVFVTGYGEPEYIEAVKEIAPFGYVMKPFDEKEIHASMEIAFYRRELELKLEKAHEELERRVESRTAELEKANKQLHKEIEARKRTEEALRESEEKYKKLFDTSPEAVALVDEEGRFLTANFSMKKRFEREIEGKTWHELMPKDLADSRLKRARQAIRNKEPVFFEDFRAGRYMENYYVPLPTSGEKRTFQIIARDITERKQAVEALRESEEKYRSLANNLNTGIYRNSVGPEGQFIEANPAIVKMFGFHNKQEFLESKVSDLYKNPEDRIAYNEKLLRNGQVKNEELQLRKKDGTVIIGSVSAVVVRGKNGDIRYFDGIIEDITERKHAEVALSETGAKFRSIFENKGTATGIFGDDGIIRECNAVFEELSGYLKFEIIDVMKWSDFVVKEDIERLQKYHAERSKKGDPPPSQYECGIINKKGETVNVIVNINSVGKDRIVSLTDITARKQAEDEREKLKTQLQQAQKMEAIGTLAGGIAHDFNNILAVILGNTELLSFDIPDSDPAAKPLKAIHQASIRAKDMVQQLLDFSRKSDAKSRPFNMTPIIKESMKMLRSAVPTSVEFKQHLSGDLCNVQGDATQIHQIVMNLVTNAAHAMSEEGGLLEVTLENITLQEEKPCFDWVLSPGEYVRLKVMDTGEGIAPTIINRIFEPYYTTKEVGKGTGMGLSVVHGIVKRHGGGIQVESELGKGTIFEIYFPALEKAAEEEKPPEGEIRGGSERILFVDDEESLVDLNRQRLERLGYDVKSTTKPVKALEWVKADPDQFDVIITDMTMPRMTGDRLAAEVLEIRPHIPVIICTGYSERMSAEKAEALGVRKYIEKPIDLLNLASSIREVLDEK